MLQICKPYPIPQNRNYVSSMQELREKYLGTGFIRAICGNWDFRNLSGVNSASLWGVKGSNPVKFSGLGNLLEGPKLCFKIDRSWCVRFKSSLEMCTENIGKFRHNKSPLCRILTFTSSSSAPPQAPWSSTRAPKLRPIAQELMWLGRASLTGGRSSSKHRLAMQTWWATLTCFFVCANISSQPYLTIGSHDVP